MNNTGQFLGVYELQGTLGKGVRSKVLRGVDGKRSVALKCLAAQDVMPEALERLKSNTGALTRLRHPAIVSFIELIETPSTIACVSDVAVGRPLSAVTLNVGASLDFKTIWDIASQLGDALTAAHARGIFHGNIRAANVFVDKEGRACLADFLGRMVEGDPSYLAPELVLGDAPSARSDVYQMGLLIYQLVSGKLPFTGTPEVVTHLALQQRPPDLSDSRHVSLQLDWVVQRALSKDPADRFGTAREFLDAVAVGLQESHGLPLSKLVLRPASDAEPESEYPKAPAKAAAQKSTSILFGEPPSNGPIKPMKEATIRPEPPKPVVPMIQPAAPPTTEQAQAQSPIVARAITAKEQVDTRKATLLVIDSRPGLAKGLERMSARAAKVHHVVAPQEAWAVLENAEVAAVIADLATVGVDDAVALFDFVKQKRPEALSVLVASESHDDVVAVLIDRGHVFKVMRKPVDPEHLRSHVAQALRRSAVDSL